jgi:acetylglutamate kinase
VTQPTRLAEPLETVLTFLESVGKRSETDLYLQLFRRLPKESFAIVAPHTSVVHDGLGALADQLGFLRKLGLQAPVVLGAFDREAGELERDWVMEALADVEIVPERFVGADPEAVRACLRADRTPVLLLGDGAEEVVVELASPPATRKLVMLRGRGGIGPHGVSRIELSPGHVLLGHASGISVVNLRSDFDALVQSGQLDAEDLELLARARRLLDSILDRGSSANTMLNVSSPLALLKELFTVRGAGTLIKRGAVIRTSDGYGDVDLPRLRALLESAFGRALQAGFEARVPLRVYLEADYRGVALIERGLDLPGAPAFLSKFAVQPVARGEGIGQDLWWSLVREHPSLYWRSRPDNPINPWYQTVCDGMHRAPRWHVYWRGVEPALLPALIEDAEGRAPDFSRAPVTSST